MQTTPHKDRLIKHYAPNFHALISPVLRLLASPRETPLADGFVMDRSAQKDCAPFTLLNRLHEKSNTGREDGDLSDDQSTGRLPPLDVAAECLDHMAAGIDTTGDALCFLMWELSQPRSLHIQARLRDALLRYPSDPASSSSSADRLLRSPPFLDAVVLEGLRCFPAIPMSLPRIVPPGGRSIAGHFVPAGAVVSCQAWSVHRIDADLFPDPEVFDPDRWLAPAETDGSGADSSRDAERRRAFFAFAAGGRGCIGKQCVLTHPFLHSASLPRISQLITIPPLNPSALLPLRHRVENPKLTLEARDTAWP